MSREEGEGSGRRWVGDNITKAARVARIAVAVAVARGVLGERKRASNNECSDAVRVTARRSIGRHVLPRRIVVDNGHVTAISDYRRVGEQTHAEEGAHASGRGDSGAVVAHRHGRRSRCDEGGTSGDVNAGDAATRANHRHAIVGDGNRRGAG